jgi:SAM-dependent methyltransferase
MAERENNFTDGAAYERMMGRWSVRVGAVFLDWLEQPPGLRWLDVGCGNGAFTELLIARTAPAEVQAIDPSEDQLAYARTRLGARIAVFHQGDAQSLPFPERRFDATAMALVITFIPDPAKAVAEMARVTRSGGSIGTYMWDVDGGGLPLEPMRKALRTIGVDYPVPPSTAGRLDRMRELWQGAGLQSVETQTIPIEVRYASFDDFWGSSTLPIGPQGRVFRSMDEATRERLKAHLRATLPVESGGAIAYRACANAVKGRVP